MWLLVEWVDEGNVFPSYAVVNTKFLIKPETDLRVGKLVFIRVKHGNSARRGQILRISEDKRQVKEYKMLLKRQDHQVQNVFSLCMKTIKDIKAEPVYFGSANSSLDAAGASGSGALHVVASDSTTSDDEVGDIIPEPSFNLQMIKSAKYSAKTKRIRNESASVPVHHSQSINQSFHLKRRSQMHSTPLPPNRREDKLFLDQGTQTDEPYMHPPAEEIQKMEVALNKLYSLFLSLVGHVHDRQVAAAIGVSVAEHNDTESHREQGLDDQTQELPNGQNLNDSNVDVERKEQQSNPRTLHVRRVSAHTTNNVEPHFADNTTDMVPIGSGSATVPARLINEINWHCYSSATRQLLQAVFPRRVLATHSLTGKQAPGFADRAPKKQLDPKIIEDIINTVSDRCGVARRLVRTSITNKCTDEAKLYRNRQLGRHLRQVVSAVQENQENVQPSPQSSPESVHEMD